MSADQWACVSLWSTRSPSPELPRGEGAAGELAPRLLSAGAGLSRTVDGQLLPVGIQKPVNQVSRSLLTDAPGAPCSGRCSGGISDRGMKSSRNVVIEDQQQQADGNLSARRNKQMTIKWYVKIKINENQTAIVVMVARLPLSGGPTPSWPVWLPPAAPRSFILEPTSMLVRFFFFWWFNWGKPWSAGFLVA